MFPRRQGQQRPHRRGNLRSLPMFPDDSLQGPLPSELPSISETMPLSLPGSMRKPLDLQVG